MDRSRIFRFSEMLYLCSFLLANKLTAFSAMGNDTAGISLAMSGCIIGKKGGQFLSFICTPAVTHNLMCFISDKPAQGSNKILQK